MASIGSVNTQTESFSSKLYTVTEAVLQMAVRIAFVVFHVFMALNLPVAYHSFALPVTAVGATSIAAFFFPSAKVIENQKLVQKYPLLTSVQSQNNRTGFPEGAPVGYENLDQNCSLNAGLQFLKSVPYVKTWMSYPLSTCNLGIFLIFLDLYDPPEKLRNDFQQYVAEQNNPPEKLRNESQQYLAKQTEKNNFLDIFVKFLDTVHPDEYLENEQPTVSSIKVSNIKSTFKDLAIIHPALEKFYQANDDAVKNRSHLSTGSSQDIREALHKINPGGISKDCKVQLCAGESMVNILGLLPDCARAQIETTYQYNQTGLPDMLEPFNPKEERLSFAILEFDQKTSSTTLSQLIQKYCTNKDDKSEPHNRQAKDGKFYDYPVKEKVVEFIEAPEALQFHLKRFAFKESKQGFFSGLFSSSSGRLTKLRIPVECPEQISIKLKNGKEQSYRLASFVTHLGNSCDGGHYVAGEILNGHKFIEDDQNITHVTNQGQANLWNEYLQEAYLLCYLPEHVQA